MREDLLIEAFPVKMEDKSLPIILAILMAFPGLFASSSTVTTEEGQNVTLLCSAVVQGGTWHQTSWFNGTQKLLTVLRSSHSKYTKRLISIVDRQSLRLHKVDRYDHGTYSCRALYIVGDTPTPAKENIQLYVKAHPIIRRTTPQHLNLTQSKEARDFQIDCFVSAYPKANVTWTKAHGQLTKDRFHVQDNNSLLVKKASFEDSGTYVCVATNELGTARKDLTVTVFEPPRIVGKKKFHANVGETANLLCDTKGHPSPKVTWSWQSATGNALSISEGKGVNGYSVTTSRRNATTRGTLVIEKVTTDNWGIYSCQAVNALGTDTSDMTLSGKTRPESPTITGVETSSSTAEVTWKFGDDGGLDLIALTLQYQERSRTEWQEIQIKPPNKVKYIISDLSPDTNYRFRMSARNSLGSSEPSTIHVAKTPKSESDVSAQSSEGFMGMSSNMTLLIGGIGGAFIIILILIIGVICFVRKLNKNHNTPASTPGNSRPTSQQEQPELTSLMSNNHHIPNIPLPQQPEIHHGAEAIALYNSPWEFPRNRVDLQMILGSGAFGLVMKGQAQGIKGCVGKMYVAVKIVKESDSETSRRDLLAELELLKLIDPHPNVIGLLGCCTRQDPLMVIVEFCAYGDLQSYLRHCRGVEDKYYQDLYRVPVEKLGSRDLLSFAIQTARGMAHLAGMKVVHRDLAARNVLIDENKVCKVADFGFARDIYVENHYTRKTQGGRFPIKWMAIESLLDGVSTTKSDVWSFGVLIWEIVTLGASPYPGMNSQEVINFLQDCYRMDKPKHCSDELYVLMLDCWQVSPQRRPTFTELSQHLTKMFSDEREYIDMRMYENHLYINFDRASGTISGKSKSGSSNHQESIM